MATTDDWNQRLNDLVRSAGATPSVGIDEYRIGPDDLLEITVFEAPELSRSVRVSASGEISLPLLGGVQTTGLTPRELELVLAELLRRTYIKDPHVGVFVSQMQSHPVAVFGAVKKPGVFQLRGPKTLIEVLSLAEGLDQDAGDTIIVTRGEEYKNLAQPAAAEPVNTMREPSPAAADPSSQGTMVENGQATAAAPETGPGAAGRQGSIEINIKALLETGDPQYNIPVYPGDVVRVAKAGIVYVVGEVNKPGGFILSTNENISVLQAVSLAEGITSVAARSQARIVRTEEQTGTRTEIPIDLGKILEGKEPDPMLQSKDIVFVPSSTARKGFYRAAEAALSIVSGVIIWRR